MTRPGRDRTWWDGVTHASAIVRTRSVARRPDLWWLPLGAACLAAWVVLAAGAAGSATIALCTAWPESPGLRSPARLAAGWALMVVAMMTPLLVAPLRHLRDRGFARRRTRAMLLFVAGYLTVWLAAGVALRTLALMPRWGVAAPAVWYGLALVAAVSWQVSPARQTCLNRCHRRPYLAAFGMAAERDAFVFGLTHGLACAGACWALMLLTLLAGPAQLPAMLAVALLVAAERLERPAPPAWGWRGPAKAARIVLAQARIRLAPRFRRAA